jgi:hypothetical protein
VPYLTGKMNGGGLRSATWASVITLDWASVITLGGAGRCRVGVGVRDCKRYLVTRSIVTSPGDCPCTDGPVVKDPLLSTQVFQRRTVDAEENFFVQNCC